MSSVVTVGNMLNDFARMAKAVDHCFELLPKPLVLQRGHTIFAAHTLTHPDVVAFDFCSWAQFTSRLDKATLVISHGGAGTLIESLERGFRPAVFVRCKRRREHIDGHQMDLCKYLHDRNAIQIVESTSDLQDYLRQRSWKATPLRFKSIALQEDVCGFINGVIRRRRSATP